MPRSIIIGNDIKIPHDDCETFVFTTSDDTTDLYRNIYKNSEKFEDILDNLVNRQYHLKEKYGYDNYPAIKIVMKYLPSDVEKIFTGAYLKSRFVNINFVVINSSEDKISKIFLLNSDSVYNLN